MVVSGKPTSLVSSGLRECVGGRAPFTTVTHSTGEGVVEVGVSFFFTNLANFKDMSALSCPTIRSALKD